MRSLLDTNLLVYADAADEPAKQQRAVQLIKELREDMQHGATFGGVRIVNPFVEV